MKATLRDVPSLQRADRILKDKILTLVKDGQELPLFSIIEFSITGLCNRTCQFCPRHDPAVYPNLNEHMNPDLYERVLRELAQFDYAGTVVFSGFSEPLLHRDLDGLVAMTKRLLPKTRLDVKSNGDKLTVNRLRTLFAAGLDTLLISLYDGPHQESFFRRMGVEAGLTEDQLVLRNRYAGKEQRFNLNLSNRAGMMVSKELGLAIPVEPLKKPCYYAAYQIMIDYQGDILLCPHDWGKKLVLGNISRNSIIDIWVSKRMHAIRKKLHTADRGFGPCAVCDVEGDLLGREQVDAWDLYYATKDAHKGHGAP